MPKHLIRVNRREGSFHVTPDGGPALEARDVAAPESGIAFGRGWYAVESYIPPEVFRWAGERPNCCWKILPGPDGTGVGYRTGPAIGGGPLELAIEVAGEAPVHRHRPAGSG